jgi:hypothetical protein
MPKQQKQMIRRLFDVVLSFILNISKTRANYWGEFAIDIPLGVGRIAGHPVRVRSQAIRYPALFC